ncbi:hypothetical protein BJ912DRAFT_973571 [Pholiota molesta]|nr:hypothetical protein BJ912DRAFT_973571 [Pholiota molesta]
MAITAQNIHSRSHHIRGWPVLPLKSKATSLPTKTSTLSENIDNKRLPHRSLTSPIPSSTRKDVTASPFTASSLQPRLSLAYGLGFDHSDPPISPLHIDERAAHDTTTYVADAGAEDPHLSDPEADDSSDSGSELSFCTAGSSGCRTPSEDADRDQFTLDEEVDHRRPLFLLPPLLLFQVDGGRASGSAVAPETPRPHAPSFSEVFFRSVPNDLRGILGEASATHDPYLHAFDVVLGRRSAAEAALNVQPDPYDHAWYAQDRICSLSVTVLEEAGGGVNREVLVGRFLLWVLEWARKYARTLEEVHITVPDSFPLPGDDTGSSPCSTCPPHETDSDGVDVLTHLKTLTWTGDTRVLPTILARFVPHSLHILRIGCAALSIGDALLLISRIAKHEIYALELGTLSTCASEAQVGTDDLRLPLRLPYLDSLKISSSIPLERFFAAVSLPPSLCKLEFDFASASKRAAEVVASLVASENLLEEYILFMDIEVECAFEGMDKAMRRIKEKAAFAYVACRGQVAEGEKGKDRA